MNYLPLLAILAGVAISLQATLNARLGVLLQNTLLGTGIAFMVATAASHFGWFDLPQSPVTLQKTIGFFALFTGVVLVNGEKIHAY